MALFNKKNVKYIICYLLLLSLPLIFMPEPFWLVAQELEEGERLLNEGISAYKEGAYDIATLYLNQAISLLTDEEKLTDCYLYLSAAHFAMGEKEKAEKNLNEILKLNPDKKLDSALATPGFIGLWNEVMPKKVPMVSVTPSEKKPEVKKSKTWLWILIGGAAAAAVAILLLRGGKKDGPIPQPTPATGSIQVKSYPNGATIFLDGNNTSYYTNHTLTDVSAGRHTILLRLAGWKDWQEDVTVNANQTAVVKPCLLPPFGCFRDNFQDGDTDNWQLGSGWNIRKVGGNYVLEGNSTTDNYYIAIPTANERHNFKLTLRLKALNFGPDGGFSIDFRDCTEGTYAVGFSNWRIVLGKHYHLTKEWFQMKTYEQQISRGSWHNIEIVIQGNDIRIFLNHQLILALNDYDAKIRRGKFDLNVWDGGYVQIDDIVMISEAECP